MKAFLVDHERGPIFSTVVRVVEFVVSRKRRVGYFIGVQIRLALEFCRTESEFM